MLYHEQTFEVKDFCFCVLKTILSIVFTADNMSSIEELELMRTQVDWLVKVFIKCRTTAEKYSFLNGELGDNVV